MRCRLGLVVVGLAMVAAAGAEKDAPPKPSLVPISWELDFEYEDIQAISLRPPGQKETQLFWYIPYTITNRSGGDRVFVPSFLLYTDSGQVLRAGQKVPTGVFTAIKKRHNNPLLVDMARITGRILQGEDNAKDGVAIWQNFDPAARSFDIFIGGLSGERAKIQLPVPIELMEKDEAGNPRKVTKTEIVLARTLRLGYAIPGEAAARIRAKPELLEKEWVMR